MPDNRNLRNICLNMLTDTLDKKELSHHVMGKIFSCADLTSKETSFLKRLYTGTLEKLVFEDFVIGSFSSVPIKKLKPVIRNILRMGIYQMKYMDSVPVYTVIDESVKLAGKRGLNNLRPFVNAILRKAQREMEHLQLPENVTYSVPEWIFDLMTEQYGKERAELYFQAISKERKETYVRFNLHRADPEDIRNSLISQGCTVTEIPLCKSRSEAAYGISGFESLVNLKAFQEGLITVQDPSSMLSVLNAADYITGNHLTVDVCAAPGGKSMLMAQLFPDAEVISRDLSSKKAELIRQNAKRLGIDNINVQVFDARKTDPDLIGKADVVISDLPCSGLGVVSRKPDILYRLKPSDLDDLVLLQRSILDVSGLYVKPGGLMIYSTCTVNREENENNTGWFALKYGFELLEEKLLFPGEWDYDGFYYACLRNTSEA